MPPEESSPQEAENSATERWRLLHGPKTLWTLIQRNRDLFLPCKTELIWGVLTLTLTNVFGIAIPLQIKLAVDELQSLLRASAYGQNLHGIQWQAFNTHLFVIAVLALFALLSRIASRVYLLGAGRRVEFLLRQQLFDHLLGMPASYYAAHPSGELLSRVGNDVDATKSIFGGGVMLGLNTILAYVLTLPLIFSLNWPLALATFTLYPLIIMAVRALNKHLRKGFGEAQSVLADISQSAQESLAGIGVIQAYAMETGEIKRFTEICDRYRGVYYGLIHYRILMFIFLAALSGFSMLLVLILGGRQVMLHHLDWGGFVAFTMYLEQLAWPTMALSYTLSIYQQGRAALERVDSVLHTEPTIQSPEEMLPTLESVPRDILIRNLEESPAEGGGDLNPAKKESSSQPCLEFRHLDFRYQNAYLSESPENQNANKSRLILNDVSLQIQSGETIGIVGPVGSGKSTLLRLLPHLYEVAKGSIFLGGVDITQMPLQELRSRMVLMPQNSFLFSSTVDRNIAFGHSRIDYFENVLESRTKADIDTHADILDIAEIAAVSGDIEKLPQQYKTIVGERGLVLSGGQRQRVALARTLLAEAEILILDDPFSNIDADTEQRILTALETRKTFLNRTTLIATHRFSLLALCDRVALMDQGQLLAIASPEELMETQPLYRQLAQLQNLRTQLADWELTTEVAINE